MSGSEGAVDIREHPDACGWRLLRDWFAARMGRPLTPGEENRLHDWLTGHPVELTPEEARAPRTYEEIVAFNDSFVVLGILLAGPRRAEDPTQPACRGGA